MTGSDDEQSVWNVDAREEIDVVPERFIISGP